MLLELMTAMGNLHHDGLVQIIGETDDVREKVKSIVRFHYMDESKPFHDTAGVWMEFWGQAPHDKEVREIIGAIQARLRKLIAGLIEEGMERGVFRAVDPYNAASVILSMIQGPTLQWNVNRKAMNIRELSKSLEDFIACYLETPCPRHPSKG